MIDFDHLNHLSHTTSILDVLDHYGITYTESSMERFKALCPFHNDHDPSLILYVHQNHIDESYYCYACNAGGDIFQFIRDMEGDFNQACHVLLLIRKLESDQIPLEKINSLLRSQQAVKEKRSIAAINSQFSIMYRDLYQLAESPEEKSKLDSIINKRFYEFDLYLSQNPSYANVHQYFKQELLTLKKIKAINKG